VTSTNGTNGAKRIGKIADLKPDSKNANLGTQRGRGLLEKSLRQYGAGRSVLVDRDGNLIAGNKTVDVAAEIDLPVRVVQTDGNELVVVQRTDLDLDSSEGRGLAIADNRTGETGLDWDTDALAELGANGIVDLEEFWRPEELEKLLSEGELAEPPPEVEFSEEILLEHNYVVLYFDNPFDWQVAVEKFGLKKRKDLIPRKGQPIGIGRVIKGAEWLEKIGER